MERISAFISYAHADDEYDQGAISDLARRLEHAVRVVTGGKEFTIFFDRTSIEWGDVWRDRIASGLASGTMLISVVTPNYLASSECRAELEQFLAQPDRERWVLPLYYLDVEDFDTRDDLVCRVMREREYVDWRHLRALGRRSQKVRREVEDLALKIRDRLRATRIETDDDLPVVSEAPREYRAQPTTADAGGPDGEPSDLTDYLLSAREAAADEEYALARALLLDALDRFADPELIFELALVDWYAGALEVAVAEYEEALASGVDEIFVLQNLGQARIELGDFERGIEELTMVIDQEKDHVSRAYARSTRALGLAGVGDFDRALSELAAAERVTPDNAWLHFNRARVHEWRGDPDAASASYLRALVSTSPPLNRPKRVTAQERLRHLGWSG